MTTLTQTVTDTVTLTDFGAFTAVEFDWGRAPTHSPPKVRVVTAADAKRIRRSNAPVDTASKTRGLIVLTAEGRQLLDAFGTVALFNPQVLARDLRARKVAIAPSVESAAELALHGAEVTVAATGILDALSSMSSAQLQAHIIEGDFGSHGVWAPGAADADGPVNVPVHAELSARYLHLGVAFDRLAEHPAVRVVSYYEGRPGGYDHVPPELNVIVQFDPDHWEQLTAAAKDRYGRFRSKGERPAAPDGSVVADAILHSPDPGLRNWLGIGDLTHDSYQEPW